MFPFHSLLLFSHSLHLSHLSIGLPRLSHSLARSLLFSFSRQVMIMYSVFSHREKQTGYEYSDCQYLLFYRHRGEATHSTVITHISKVISIFNGCWVFVNMSVILHSGTLRWECSEIRVDSQSEFTSYVYQQLSQWHSIEMVTCIVEYFEARGHYFYFWKNNVPKVNRLFLRTRC
jgi:hypothetical protein